MLPAARSGSGSAAELGLGAQPVIERVAVGEAGVREEPEGELGDLIGGRGRLGRGRDRGIGRGALERGRLGGRRAGRGLCGDVGPRARRVQVFIDGLRARLPAGIEVHIWDERFSTVAVERVLIEADLSRRRRRQVVDRQAAAYILQGWLDARRPAG